MEKQAITKYVRLSAFRAREITRLIQGKAVNEAMAIVDFCPRKSARLVGKTLRSATANAVNDERNPVPQEDLFVKEATVGEGPTMKRYIPKARGMAGRIRRRTSHIKIIVTDEK